jgi:tripartite-type tricarboxylate transporter receptor subunit TctC
MVLRRRTLLQLAAALLAAPARDAIAVAGYPQRPVRLVVGFSPGGNTDIVARLMGQWLTQQLNQPFVIENRTGAATNIATESVVRAPPDGYTLLVASTSNAINATLYGDLKFDFIRDTEPVAPLVKTPLVMIVHPEFPARSVPEFVAVARAGPDSLNFGSSGIGSPPHVAAELFKSMAAIKMVHIPYRGDIEAITDVIAKRVHVYFATLPGAIEFIRAGRARALAVTATTRSSALPDVPAMAEFLTGYDASVWNGINAPKGVAASIVLQLNQAVNTGLDDPKLSSRLAELGAKPFPGSPGDYATFIVDETEKWARIVRSSGARIDGKDQAK